MITDSPYSKKSLLLSWNEGVVGGILGIFAMLGIYFLLSFDLCGFIASLGGGSAKLGSLIWVSLGAIGGGLHAACQQRESKKALLVVGLFYGFILWIGSRFLAHLFLESLQGYTRQGAWFWAHLTYGLVLGGVACAKDHWGPRPEIELKD